MLSGSRLSSPKSECTNILNSGQRKKENAEFLRKSKALENS